MNTVDMLLSKANQLPSKPYGNVPEAHSTDRHFLHVLSGGAWVMTGVLRWILELKQVKALPRVPTTPWMFLREMIVNLMFTFSLTTSSTNAQKQLPFHSEWLYYMRRQRFPRSICAEKWLESPWFRICQLTRQMTAAFKSTETLEFSHTFDKNIGLLFKLPFQKIKAKKH